MYDKTIKKTTAKNGKFHFCLKKSLELRLLKIIEVNKKRVEKTNAEGSKNIPK